MSQALAQAGLVANATGLSIEETTGGLAAFASAGLLGSDAGTSFKSMLQRLTPQSAAAQNAMDDLGISAYDAGGNFIGLADFAGNLQESLRSLTPEQRQAAMATIFGSDRVRAATILYNQGAEGIRKWTDEVNDQGYAAETAAKRLDNLQGDLEGLGGAIDSALIKQGSGANDSLRALTTAATGAVTGLSQLPEPIQQAALYLGIATAAVGLFGGAAAVGVPKVVAFKTAIDGTKYSMRGLSLAAGGLTIGLAAVISIVAAVAAEQAEAESRAQSYSDTLEQGTRRVTAATREMTVANLAASKTEFFHDVGSAYDNAEALGISIDLVTDAAMGSADAIAKLSTEIESSKSRHDELGLSAQAATLFADRLSNSVKGEASSLERAAEVARQKEEAERSGAAATERAASSTDTAAAAYMNAATQAEDLTEELDKLIESMNAANGTNQDAISTNARWRESLDGISGEVKEQREAYERAHGSLDGFTMSLDRGTTSGASMADMLSSVAGNAQAAATAQYEVDKTTVGAKAAADNYAATLATQRAAFEEAARAAGFNAEEVSRLGDEVFALPPEKAVDILAQTGAATQATQDFRALWDGIRSKTISITAILRSAAAMRRTSGLSRAGTSSRPAARSAARAPARRTRSGMAVERRVRRQRERRAEESRPAELHQRRRRHVRLCGGAMVGASATSSVRMLPIAGRHRLRMPRRRDARSATTCSRSSRLRSRAGPKARSTITSRRDQLPSSCCAHWMRT